MPFIRRTQGAQAGSAPAAAPQRGTRPSPTGQKLVSSGVGSLDDILGGGLPLSTSLLLLAPDVHTQWSRLVARHIASAGLIDGQEVVVLAPRSWGDGLPWLDPRSEGSESEGEVEGNTGRQREEKIAWRYDRMGRFRTTVGSSRIAANTTIPVGTRAELEEEGRLKFVDPGETVGSLLAALGGIKVTQVTRIIIPDLGGLELPLTKMEISRVLFTLRYLLRSMSAIGVVTLPAKYDQPSHLADAVLSLQGFGGAPGLAKAYYPSHGLITPHVLYSGHNVVAPALRYSQLLGVASGAGEQNLGFRLKRKRWVVESVHLGIEGGSGERRTEPVVKTAVVEKERAVEGIELAKVTVTEGKAEVKEGTDKVEKKKPRAKVRFGEDMEDRSTAKDHTASHSHDHAAHTPVPRRARFAEDVEDGHPTAKDHTASHSHDHSAHSQVEQAHVHFAQVERTTAKDHTASHSHDHAAHAHAHAQAHFGEVQIEHPSTARDHTASHSHPHAHGPARVEIDHNRPDLYEF